MQIEQLLERIDQAPVMAPVHARLLHMIRDTDVSARELSEAISEDPSLTAQVLRLVNSAVYGFPRQIGTVSQAVLILGFDAIGRHVLGHARRALMEPSSNAGPLDFTAFWQHSVAVAAGARTLAHLIDHADQEALFVAGLLHDIGRVLLAQCVPDAFEQALDRAWRFRISLYEAERQVIGFSHSRLGAEVALRWDLPDFVVDAIAFHHEPDLTERHRVETHLVGAADTFARSMGLGSSGDNRVEPIPKATCELLGIEAEDVEELMESILAEFNQVSAHVLGVLRSRQADRADLTTNTVKSTAKSADL
jgi:putative nucleotidyltransferase with HDIG domain